MKITEQELDRIIRENLAAAFPEAEPPEEVLNAALDKARSVEAGREAEKLLATHTREGPDTRSLLAVATIGRMTLAGVIPDVDYRSAGRQLAQSREFANLVGGRSPAENLERIRSGTLIRELGGRLKEPSREGFQRESLARSGPAKETPEIKAPEKEPPIIPGPGAGSGPQI